MGRASHNQHAVAALGTKRALRDAEQQIRAIDLLIASNARFLERRKILESDAPRKLEHQEIVEFFVSAGLTPPPQQRAVDTALTTRAQEHREQLSTVRQRLIASLLTARTRLLALIPALRLADICQGLMQVALPSSPPLEQRPNVQPNSPNL
jgi:hypothetical protein